MRMAATSLVLVPDLRFLGGFLGAPPGHASYFRAARAGMVASRSLYSAFLRSGSSFPGGPGWLVRLMLFV